MKEEGAKMCFKLVRIGIGQGIPLLCDYFFHIRPYGRKPGKFPLEKRYARLRRRCQKLLKGFRVDLKVKGIETLYALEEERKPFLITLNHLSVFDIVTLIAAYEKPLTFVAKSELEHKAIIGNGIRSIDGFFLNRQDLRQSLRLMKDVQHYFESGGALCIFPEGTRNHEPLKARIGSYHPGSFHSAMKSGATIVPACIIGTSRVLDWSFNPKRVPINLTFLAPIGAEEYASLSGAELATKVEDLTQQAIDEELLEQERFFLEGKEKVPLRKGPVR